jgi:MFS family permease
MAMGPAAVFGEKRDKTKNIFLISISLFGAGYLIMGNAHSIYLFVFGFVIFFVGFSMQEPLLQSSVTKFSKVYQRGATLGIFNTFQSIGAFLGGLIGGFAIHNFSVELLGDMISIIALLWFFWTLKMQNPTKKDFLYLPSVNYDIKKVKNISSVEGVLDYYINNTEHILVVKYDSKIIEKDNLLNKLHKMHKNEHSH